MNNSERRAVIEKLMKPEASDGAGYGVIGLGAAAVGTILKPSALVAVASTAVTILPMALIVVSVGGLSLLTLRNLSKKERGH